MLMFDIILP